MAYTPTERAYRFTVGDKQYALDIQADGIVWWEPSVSLFHLASDGWNMHYQEMLPQIKVNQEEVDAGGGLVQFCKMVVERVNNALRRIHGAANPEPGEDIQSQVMDYLREHLTLITVDGVPQLRLD